jgi:hypothetical protein
VTGALYEIVVSGRLGGALTRWFDELEVHSSESNGTHLRGWFPDQPALQGMLAQIGELGLELESVRRIGAPDQRAD